MQKLKGKRAVHTDIRKQIQATDHSDLYHHQVHGFSDRFAYGSVKFAAAFADFFFKSRWGHRAVVLETVAAVPGMVGGLLQHLKSLRWLRDDRGWIRTLLDEAENERVHLLVYGQIAKPTVLERVLIMIAQAVFYNVYFWVYLFTPRTAHRIVGYLEEEAVHSYTTYLAEVERGTHENIPAPELAIKYWNLKNDARLSDVIRATCKDEMNHRDINHDLANRLSS